MDTTEKYIKLCEKAEEIQGLRPEMQTRIHIGGGNICLVSHKTGGSYFYCHDIFEEDSLGNMIIIDTKAVWLPRQDQLQEMLKVVNWNTLLFRLDTFIEYADGKSEFDYIESMEQLWLAFVMHAKYGKVWDNEKNEWLEKCPTNADISHNENTV